MLDQFAIAIAIILAPGILTAIVCDKIVVHAVRWDSFKYILYSYILGFLVYGLLQFVLYFYDLVSNLRFLDIKWSNLSIWTYATDKDAKLNLIEVFWAITLSLPMAFVVSYVINHKFFNKLARVMGVSSKYGDENLYSFFLNSQEVDWVYIRDIEKNLSYRGRVDSFSENNKFQEILLYDVTVYRLNDSFELYGVERLYLSREQGHLMIESIV